MHIERVAVAGHRERGVDGPVSTFDAVVAALERAPGRRAVDLRDELRAAGMGSITTADVLRVLRLYDRRFHHDGAAPERWYLSADVVEAADPDESTTITPHHAHGDGDGVTPPGGAVAALQFTPGDSDRGAGEVTPPGDGGTHDATSRRDDDAHDATPPDSHGDAHHTTAPDSHGDAPGDAHRGAPDSVAPRLARSTPSCAAGAGSDPIIVVTGLATTAPTTAGCRAVESGDGATDPSPSSPDGPPLYAWQTEALDAWRRQGSRGVVEAVTGAGKTMVGVAAARAELETGGQVCVLVPTRDLLAQWQATLHGHLPPTVRVGLLGAGHTGSLGRDDVLVAVVNSARSADLRPRRPGGLLIADECHRYGSAMNQAALDERFPRRLGLSATYARADDGNLKWLDPYFGSTCFRLGYARAIADGVTARVRVALVGVRFDPDERTAYDDLTQQMRVARSRLIASDLVPADPVGEFLAAVARLARSGDDEQGRLASAYLGAMQDRRRLLAETPAKTDLLAALSPALMSADRSLVFTQSIAAAERAAAVLAAQGLRAAPVHSELPLDQRGAVLARFAAGDLDAVAAPQVLDEGIDVPAADLAVVLAASRSRRQMIQRMGRVLRRKADGRAARFAVAFVEATVEDPAHGAHDTFLDELTGVADAVEAFPAGRPPDDAVAFLTDLGPAR